MTQPKYPPPPPLVNVTVDGRELQLPKGKNLLQALLEAGVYVPHYCYHPALSVAGNCRLCLVEIEGRPKPEVSCNMTVADGLKIKVNSPVIDDCRKGMMEFLLVNHPLDCPVCDRGGECMLQRYSVQYGWGTARTADERRRFPKPQIDPLIDIERNRCIMCTRCVRFCDEVAGEHVLGVFGHGNRNYIGSFGNGPVANLFSGNVIDLCPVGCLTSKPFRFQARVWELRQTLTTTRTCNGAVTAWTRGGRLRRVTPPVRKYFGATTLDEDTTDFISNEARFGSMHANSAERILEPQVRRDGELKTASWAEALELAAGALREAAPGKVCILAGERSTNEEFFLLRRLAERCATENIDWRMRFASGEAAQAAGAALAAGTADLDLLEKGAYGATILVNADVLGSAPDLALRLREAARLKRTKLGIVGPRIEPWLEPLAASACLEAPEDLASVIENLAEAVEQKTAPEGYEKLFALLTGNEQGVIALGLDTAGGALNAALVPAVFRLLDALGSGWQLLPLTAARNARGAAPGGAQGQTPAPELLRRAAAGEFKVLVLHRCDELVTHPQRALIEKALKATPTVIVTDIFPSWIHAHAAAVLPGALFYETDGSMTDADGTLQRMAQGCRPAGGAQEDWRILESLAELLGAPKRYRTIHEIFADLIREWGAPAFTLGDLALPGPGSETPQRTHHYQNLRKRPEFKLRIAECGMRNDQFQIADCRLQIADEDARVPRESAINNPQSAIRLLWIHHVWGEDHQSSRAQEYIGLMPRPPLELHPDDARRLGLKEGDTVAVQGAATSSSCPVALNPMLAPGCAFGAANALGLRVDGAGLPAVRLIKAAAPAPKRNKEVSAAS